MIVSDGIDGSFFISYVDNKKRSFVGKLYI